MSADYREYKNFIEELKAAGVKGLEALAYHLKNRFDYLAEDEVMSILSDLI